MSDIQYISVKEFREQGYLHEVNRRFLHPLGLALEVKLDTNGEERLGRIWGSREDPEGIYYGADILDPAKATKIQSEWDQRVTRREEKLGYMVQPIPINETRTESN